jgi:hypothetical protein
MHTRTPPCAAKIVVAALLIVLAGAAIGAGDDLLLTPGRAAADVSMQPDVGMGWRGGWQWEGPPDPQGTRGLRGKRGPRGRRGPQGLQGPPGAVVIRETHSSTPPEWITAIATVLAAVAAVIAGLFGYRVARATIEEGRNSARQRVTYEAVAGLEDPGLLESKAVLASFLHGGLRPPLIDAAAWEALGKEGRIAASWEHLRESASLADRRRVFQILAFPNMLESIANMYNRGLLDGGIVKTTVEWAAADFWKKAASWIDELQAADANTFTELDAMIHKLATQERPTPS